MKTKMLGLATGILLGSATAVFAGEKTATFEVKGNCGMCEKTIEKAASSVEGVTKADWDKESKKMTVTFDDVKTDLGKIHKAIAKSGYDTGKLRADNETYEALPACCQYERDTEK